MRIVYCLNSLAQTGGIEATTVTKANALAAVSGYEVWIITLCDNSLISEFSLSRNVHLVGVDNVVTWHFPWNLFQIVLQWFKIKKRLLTRIQRINPDVVVSTGGLDKWFVPWIKGDWATIREVHCVKDYRRRQNGAITRRILARLGEILDYSFCVKRFDRIVVLTNEDRSTNWGKNDRVMVIPNPVRFAGVAPAPVAKNHTVIAVGRLVSQKNFEALIRAFGRVSHLFPDWQLSILGEGEERSRLEETIACLSLQNRVFLRGNQPNVSEWMTGASVFAMTSSYEGFALAMVEAMGCGLPVVSYTFPTGPKDIITDGEDGFLVPQGDEGALADRLRLLMGDEMLRKQMGTAAFSKARHYSIENILLLWCRLFENMR